MPAKQNPRSFFVSTDTLPILDRRFTDILPTHCRCYRDRLSVDLSTESDPMIGRYIAYIAADARSILARYSTDNRPILGGYIDRDIDRQSTVTRPTYRPLPSIEAPYKTQDPNSLRRRQSMQSLDYIEVLSDKSGCNAGYPSRVFLN